MTEPYQPPVRSAPPARSSRGSASRRPRAVGGKVEGGMGKEEDMKQGPH